MQRLGILHAIIAAGGSAGVSIEADRLAREAGLTAAVTGSGPDVVVVHGSLGDYRQWQPVAAVLQERYRVIALSRRFHWPNPAPPDGACYSYESHRDDLLRYLLALGRPVHLVGHSYGAGVALLAALCQPSLLHALVVIEPALHSLLPADGPALATESASRDAMLATVRAQAAAGQDEEAARSLTDWIQGGGGFDALPPDVRRGLLDNAATVGPTFSRAAPALSCDDLRALQVPTLVLNGERTRLYYRLIGERLAACLPAGTHQTIPDAAHMTIVERPAETAAIISSFLARVWSA
jgi:pimeloyl-ACP methyl ester carboxylesterase